MSHLEKFNKESDELTVAMVDGLNRGKPFPQESSKRPLGNAGDLVYSREPIEGAFYTRHNLSQLMDSATKEKVSKITQSAVGISVILIFATFLIGVWWGGNIDYPQKITAILSCDYSLDALQKLGYADFEQCQSLSAAILSNTIDKCENFVGTIGDMSRAEYSQIINQCVYHDLSNQVEIARSRALRESR